MIVYAGTTITAAPEQAVINNETQPYLRRSSDTTKITPATIAIIILSICLALAVVIVPVVIIKIMQ